jgi:hypothetical protein
LYLLAKNYELLRVHIIWQFLSVEWLTMGLGLILNPDSGRNVFLATVIEPAVRPEQCVPSFRNGRLIFLIHESQHSHLPVLKVWTNLSLLPLPHKSHGKVRKGRDNFFFIVFLLWCAYTYAFSPLKVISTFNTKLLSSLLLLPLTPPLKHCVHFWFSTACYMSLILQMLRNLITRTIFTVMSIFTVGILLLLLSFNYIFFIALSSSNL